MSLTLEQAEKANRFAWHPSGLVYIRPDSEGVAGSVLVISKPSWDSYGYEPEWAGDWQIPRDGWRHSWGCDCEFCREGS